MVIVPSFNGVFIFGENVIMATSDPPRDKQINKYLGVNGVEILDHGSRQRQTDATGRLSGLTLAELAAKENIFRSYKDPFAYTLITTDGLVWLDVVLESFEPQPPIRQDALSGLFWRNYRARFLHCR
jgi:hypothetical protein